MIPERAACSPISGAVTPSISGGVRGANPDRTAGACGIGRENCQVGSSNQAAFNFVTATTAYPEGYDSFEVGPPLPPR